MQIQLIRERDDTPLTIDNLKKWLVHFKQHMKPIIDQNSSYFLNTREDELPYAKKIVTIAAAATIGDGVEVKMSEEMTPAQEEVFEKILRLFKKQTIDAEDLEVFTDGSTYGYANELAYMSDDEVPLPKVKKLDPYSFVVFDDTAENNSLYGVYFNEVGTDKNREIEMFVFDDVLQYRVNLKGVWLENITDESFLKSWDNRRFVGDECCDCWFIAPNTINPIESVIGTRTRLLKSADDRNLKSGMFNMEIVGEHNMGRMPITMYFNNNELQGDFEQVKKTIDARNTLNKLAMDDSRAIASNILAIEGNLAGNTRREKRRTVEDISDCKALEYDGNPPFFLTKQETFNMISVFGRDLEDKIYDLSMVVDFTSKEFAGNVSGIALRLKLFPFKRMVRNKDYFIEKLYKRRIKMYQYALTGEGYEPFDVADIDIVVNRTWEENVEEIARTINMLNNSGLFSKQTLTEMLPRTDYETEIQRKAQDREIEQEIQAQSVDPMNTNISAIRDALLQNMQAQDEEVEDGDTR